MCTLSVYKTNEASSVLPEGERDEINNLPGQHIGDVRVSGRQVNLIQDLFSVLGLTINSRKSQLSPVQELIFLGHQVSTAQRRIFRRFRKFAAKHSSCRKVIGNNLGAGCICGNDQCSKKKNYSHSSFVSSSHTGPDKQGGSSSRAERGETMIPKNGSPHIRSPDRTAVVGQDCQEIQIYPTNTTTARSSNQDGCIPVGLGCQVPGAPHRRPLTSGQWRNRRCILML